MNKFTSSERRGAIVILAIIACITIYLAVSRGVGRNAPEPTAMTAPPENTIVDTVTTTGKKHPKKRTDKSSERSSGKAHKKKKTSSETNKSRDPLNEPVSK